MTSAWRRLGESRRGFAKLVFVATGGLALGGVFSVLTGDMSPSTAGELGGLLFLLVLLLGLVAVVAWLSAKVRAAMRAS